jgi:hypothetical protein
MGATAWWLFVEKQLHRNMRSFYNIYLIVFAVGILG